MDGSVRLRPHSFRSRTELENKLRAYNLSLEGTVTILRQHLAEYLEQIQIEPLLRDFGKGLSRGKCLTLVHYPADVSAMESLAVCGQLVHFVSTKSPRNVGGVYSFNLAGGLVDVVLKKSEIKRVEPFKNKLFGFYRF